MPYPPAAPPSPGGDKSPVAEPSPASPGLASPHGTCGEWGVVLRTWGLSQLRRRCLEMQFRRRVERCGEAHPCLGTPSTPVFLLASSVHSVLME